jgi:replication initiation protein RepC
MAQENCAPEAPQGSIVPAPIRAFGARRINLEMRVRLDEADKFTGLPKGSAKPYVYLAAFERAEAYLGLPAQASKLVAWLVRLTEPQDWEEGSRPIAYPSAERQAEFLGGMSLRAVQLLNRRLWEAGIFVMRDDPQGRRHGDRDKRTRRLTKAFGFDLSPLALRYEEFKKIAADAQVERNRMGKLRRQATLARRGIKQALEELGVQGQDNEAIRQLDRETDDLVVAARACKRSDELAVAVKALQRRRDEAEQMLRDLIKPVETGPMGEENDAHSTSTTLTSNNINYTVDASEGCSQAQTAVPDDQPSSRSDRLFPESLQITPATLVELCPRLAPHMPARFNDQTWPAIVEAAHYLSGELGINQTLWARACTAMGREYAAVAVAIVSTRPHEHFTSGPGGYFAGMLRKFEKNPQDLCLNRTLWALKNEVWGKDGHKERREVEKRRRIETRTKRSRHPDLDLPREFPSREPARTSVGGFAPVGSVLQQQPTTWPVPPARPRPTLSLPSTSKDWKPSQELRDAEQRINAMLANGSKNATPMNGPATPRKDNNS